MLKAQKIPLVFGVSLTICVVLMLYSDVSVEFPLGKHVLPLSLTLPAAIALVHGYALVNWWTEYTKSAMRYNWFFRGRQLTIAIFVSLLASAPLLIVVRDERLTANTILSVVTAQLAVMVIGELYWIPVAVIGFALLALQLSSGLNGDHLAEFYESSSLWWFVSGILVTSLLLYSINGPRALDQGSDEI